MDKERRSIFAIIIPAVIFCVLIVAYTFFDNQSIEIISYTNDDVETIILHDTALDINEASLDDFMEVEGIGEVTAQKIIDYRVENGGFTRLEQLKNIDGIGDKTFEMLSKYFYIK